jgi:hypothetical protein
LPLFLYPFSSFARRIFCSVPPFFT